MSWNLRTSGTTEVYVEQLDSNGRNPQFVARFKHMRPRANARAFVRFLMANFTPDQYFAQMNRGVPPLTILKAKGYVSPNEKRADALAMTAERRPFFTVL